MSVLSVIGILGLIDYFHTGISLFEYLVPFHTLSHPTVFLLLWCLTALEIFVRSKHIASQVCNENNIGSYSPELNVYFYMMFSTISLGFGLIFGTMGIFANTDDPLSYLSTIGSAMLFVSISNIIARGYIKDSPICDFIITGIKSKVNR